MATHTQIGSVTVDAFQWTGQAFSTLPVWARQIALHNTGVGTLCVPSRMGCSAAVIGSWVVRDADGSVMTMPNSAFVALYS